MNRAALLDRLDRLTHDPLSWDFDREARIYSAHAGPYRMVVRKVVHDGTLSTPLERGNVNAMWSVAHEGGETLIEPTPSSVVLYAKRDAIAFVRAHILQESEPITA